MIANLCDLAGDGFALNFDNGGSVIPFTKQWHTTKCRIAYKNHQNKSRVGCATNFITEVSEPKISAAGAQWENNHYGKSQVY